jgi:hypothetical protein
MTFVARTKRNAGYVVPASEWNQGIDNEDWLKAVVDNKSTWIEATGWSYASPTTINVPSGAASIYAVGAKLKWTQTTLKQSYVVAIADTLLTVAGDVVANAAITNPYYSLGATPVGFPQWFDFTPTISQGTSTDITNTIHYSKFCLNGRLATWKFYCVFTDAGQSGGYAVKSTLPIDAIFIDVDIVGHGNFWDLDVAGYFIQANLASSTQIVFVCENKFYALGTDPNFAIAYYDLMAFKIEYQI